MSEIITILIELPNTSAFNYDFYKSVTMMLYKRSTNGLTFWVVLESATFSFKLMKFVKNKLNIHGRTIISKRGQTIFLFKQLFKFLIFYIPKIITFFVIYFIFYFLFDFYTSNFQVSMTFHYIFKNFIFSKHCYTEILYIFFPFMNYKYELPYDYNSISFPFIYVYSNMFYSSLLFMIILIIVFFFQYFIIDLLITLAAFFNLIISFIIYYNKDSQKNISYKFIHFSGENYSIVFPHVFFSIYYFGCLLGLSLYYYSEYNIELPLNLHKSPNNSFNLKNLSDESFNMTNLERISTINSFKNKNVENKDDDKYKPMKFCSSFIIRLRNTSIITKFILLFIYLIIIIFLSTFVVLLYKYYYNSFIINMKDIYNILILLYFSEKIINVFLFYFFHLFNFSFF